ncbi:MAG: right-handed parallel beta-helix repeat-containing protein [Bdellovibrionales bacterium]|nr:right-handed parallel beta-helix repeat-containing protein [Bdellovibrionales bacterium]
MALANCQLADNSIQGSIKSSPSGTPVAPPSSLSYSSVPTVIYAGDSFLLAAPSLDGVADSFSISPSLPPGLLFNTQTGAITGTPSEPIAETTYTITASNSAGSTETQIQIGVGQKFSINANGDGSDYNLGDNNCDNGSGACTLRAAVEEANNEPGVPAKIVTATSYSISLSSTLVINSDVLLENPHGIKTVLDASGLERGVDIISGDVTIDGFTIDGASSGSSLANGVGLKATNSKLHLLNCQISNNSSSSFLMGTGAYIVTSQEFLMDNCTVTNNSSTNGSSDGAGLFIQSPSGEVANSIFTNNNSAGGGGAITKHSGYFLVRNSQFSNNQSEYGGGAIKALFGIEIQSTTFTSNSNNNIQGGGAIYAQTGDVKIMDSEFQGNTAAGGANYGAHIYGTGWSSGSLISGSTFSSGNYYSVYLHSLTSDFTVVNSTFSNNPFHLVINADAAASLTTLQNVTFSGATSHSLAVYDSDVEVVNSIFAGASTNNCTISGVSTLVSLGGNIDDDNSCGFAHGTDLSTNPQFDVAGLANNGGSTQTISLQAGSPALDSGLNAYCPTTDQRGLPRPADGGGGLTCDRGAVEKQ